MAGWLKVSDEVGNVNLGVASAVEPREECTEPINLPAARGRVQYVPPPLALLTVPGGCLKTT